MSDFVDKSSIMDAYFDSDSTSKSISPTDNSSVEPSVSPEGPKPEGLPDSGQSETTRRKQRTKPKKGSESASDFTALLHIDVKTHRMLKRLQVAYYLGEDSRMTFSALIRELLRLSKNRIPDTVASQLGEGFWQELKK